jgi:hypothetical protein
MSAMEGMYRVCWMQRNRVMLPTANTIIPFSIFSGVDEAK